MRPSQGGNSLRDEFAVVVHVQHVESLTQARADVPDSMDVGTVPLVLPEGIGELIGRLGLLKV